jgi:hypothetical protein|tara:strand:- start:4880 stop:5392 length:513 start_codon:yes stop_codon:yes gene_type:complete
LTSAQIRLLRESFRRLLSLSFWEESTFFSQIFSKIFSKQIGKTAITLPPPKEIAKYVCFILTLWAFVAGLFGALLSIAVQMRRYKYRSLPQKFIGNFRYGDSSRMTYPTSQRGLYPWVAKVTCELTTTSNSNSFVNNDVTVWPTCVPSAADNNPLGFEVVTTCGKACLNP